MQPTEPKTAIIGRSRKHATTSEVKELVSNSGMFGTRKGQEQYRKVITVPKSVEKHLANCFERYLRVVSSEATDEECHQEFFVIDRNWKQWVNRNPLLIYDKYEYLFASRVKKFFPHALSDALDYFDKKKAEAERRDAEAEGVAVAEEVENATNSMILSEEKRLNAIGLIRG